MLSKRYSDMLGDDNRPTAKTTSRKRNKLFEEVVSGKETIYNTIDERLIIISQRAGSSILTGRNLSLARLWKEKWYYSST